MLQNLNHLKNELLEDNLKKEKNDLKQQVEGLRNLLSLTKAAHEDRSNSLR